MSVQWVRLEGVRAFYRTGEEITLGDLARRHLASGRPSSAR